MLFESSLQILWDECSLLGYFVNHCIGNSPPVPWFENDVLKSQFSRVSPRIEMELLHRWRLNMSNFLDSFSAEVKTTNRRSNNMWHTLSQLVTVLFQFWRCPVRNMRSGGPWRWPHCPLPGHEALYDKPRPRKCTKQGIQCLNTHARWKQLSW